MRSRPALLVVPAGAEVGEPGRGVGEEVPDDDEDGSSDGALGLVPAEAAGQPAEPFAEERTGVRGAVGGLGAVDLEVGVALSLLRLALPGAGLAGDRGQPGQDTR